jgi:hypothetical protein
MEISQYRALFSSEGSTPGWGAIDRRVDEVYPGVEPAHFAAAPHYALGGNDRLDGVSIYRCQVDGGWHYQFPNESAANERTNHDLAFHEQRGCRCVPFKHARAGGPSGLAV